jgi:hypothetical protein
MGCAHAQGFLAKNQVEVKKTADAKSARRVEAMRLAKAASKVIVTSAKIVEFDMKNNPPEDGVLLTHMLGPTGNLRAPTLRVGKTVVVGFNDGVYGAILG